MTQEIVSKVRQELVAASDEKTKLSFRRFFKEPVIIHGVKSAEVGRITRAWLPEIKQMPKVQVFALCQELLDSDYCEEGWVAANWAHAKSAEFLPEDLDTFADWINRTITNWAECDTFCNHTVGTLLEMYPQLAERMKVWAVHSNLWMRRAAAVSLILPARSGKFLPLVFDLADLMLLDKQDMVQKGYGWLLKEASHQHQQEVFEFVLARRASMPRTALRYAIEKMPPTLRARAMEKPNRA